MNSVRGIAVAPWRTAYAVSSARSITTSSVGTSWWKPRLAVGTPLM